MEFKESNRENKKQLCNAAIKEAEKSASFIIA